MKSIRKMFQALLLGGVVPLICYASEPPPVFERSICCFNAVPAVAVDAGGNVYVADFMNSTISKFGPGGNFVTSWTPGPAPIDVEVGPDGAVWVATQGDQTIRRFTPEGGFLSTFVSFSDARELAFDPTGNVVYVLDSYFGNVRKYTRDGTLIAGWSTGQSLVVGMAVDSSGNVYVVPNGHQGPILKFNSDGVLIGQIAERNSLIGMGQLAIDSQDNIYASGARLAADTPQSIPILRKFSPSGTLLSQVDGFAAWGLAVGADGKIYVGANDGPASETWRVHIFVPGSLRISIDIKPGSDPNSINPRSEGVIPVAILTTAAFDATTVDSTTVLFGATGTEAAPVQSALEDVDGDGDTDMILHFNTQDTGIKCGDTSASLTGETLGGQMIEGSDSIKTVGCK